MGEVSLGIGATWLLLVLTVAAFVVIGGLIAVVALLAHPKTRAIGAIATLIVLSLLVIGGLGLFAVLFVAKGKVSKQRKMEAVRSAIETDRLTAEMEERASAEKPGDSDPGAVLKALGSALGKGIAENKKKQRDALAARGAGEPPPAPPNKPAWIGRGPQRAGEVYRMSIDVGPYTTRLECDANLPESLQAALDQYVKLCLGQQAAGKVRLPPGELREMLVKEEWEETRQYTVGPMKHLHVLLEFDRQLKNRIEQQWKDTIIAERLWVAGGGVTAALALLFVLFGYLKITGRST